VSRISVVVRIEIAADLGGNRKPGRHRQSEVAHLGKARPFAAEQVSHVGAPLGAAVAEPVDPFCHAPFTLRSVRSRRPDSSWHGSPTTTAGGSRAIWAHRY